MTPEFVIRAGVADDARSVARLHHEELEESFLALLGARFLTRLYRRVQRDDASSLLVAVHGPRVIGFVAATDDTRRFYAEFVRRDAFRAGVAAAPRLLRHPRQVAETLAYSRSSAELPARLPRAELLSLAVSRDWRRQGVGASLVRQLQADLARREVPGMRVVVAADNRAAEDTYRACGFVRVARIEVHRGCRSVVLVWR